MAPADYIRLSQFRWCCKVKADTYYAVRHVQVRAEPAAEATLDRCESG